MTAISAIVSVDTSLAVGPTATPSTAGATEANDHRPCDSGLVSRSRQLGTPSSDALRLEVEPPMPAWLSRVSPRPLPPGALPKPVADCSHVRVLRRHTVDGPTAPRESLHAIAGGAVLIGERMRLLRHQGRQPRHAGALPQPATSPRRPACPPAQRAGAPHRPGCGLNELCAAIDAQIPAARARYGIDDTHLSSRAHGRGRHAGLAHVVDPICHVPPEMGSPYAAACHDRQRRSGGPRFERPLRCAVAGRLRLAVAR